MNIIMRKTEDLIPYERNQKKHDDKQIANVANSIKRFGWQQPIVIDKKDVIVIGHCRLLAAQKLGLDEVPCTVADDLTEDEIRELRIADNATNISDWNLDSLSIDLKELDFDGFNFDFDDLPIDIDEQDETEQIEEDDFDPEQPVETKAKLGDIWQLGRHRLMCGDSTSPEEVQKLTCGIKAALLLTDPPYGIKADKGFSGAEGFDGKGKPIERRHYKDDWDSERPGKTTFEMILQETKQAMIFGGNFFTDFLPVGNHWLVWNKHNTMPTFSDAELAWTNIKRNSVKLYDIEWNGLIGKEKERFHPTQKPVKLFADIIGDYTDPGETVFDFFGGAGTTLIACEKTGRNCYMMELDPHYVDVIIKRWEDFTGEQAVLLNV